MISVYIGLTFRREADGLYHSSTTAVAATSSAEAEQLWRSWSLPTFGRCFIFTDEFVAENEAHGHDGRVQILGGGKMPMTEVQFAKWREEMCGPSSWDGETFAPTYREVET